MSCVVFLGCNKLLCTQKSRAWPHPQASQQFGTSFAAPYALRSAASVGTQLGSSLNPLALRSLMIHRAESGSHERSEVGWGRFESDHTMLITCDDEALVVYQGELPVSQHLRAPIPVPDASPLKGMVTISATLVIAPEVDPEYPGAYTRSGLEVIFRPNILKYNTYEDGTISKPPKSKSFFSATKMYSGPEYLLREDDHKWEPCLKHCQRFMARTLNKPVFDIYYHHRASGSRVENPRPISYALIVSVKAPQVVDLYNQVVRSYAGVLVPLKPYAYQSKLRN